MDILLLSLMTALEGIGLRHAELYDTVVRERMAETLLNGFVEARHGFELVDEYGMFSDKGNEEVGTAIRIYIQAAKKRADALGLEEQQRQEAVWNYEVVTSGGQYVDDLLGAI